LWAWGAEPCDFIFEFPLVTKHDSLAASEENDAAEEARDDEIRRAVPSAAGPDHQLKHELAQLAGQIDWDFIDGEVAPLCSYKGRPGIPTRFAIGLLLLKHIYGLSDEGVCERWVYDPYFPVRSSSSMSSRTSAPT